MNHTRIALLFCGFLAGFPALAQSLIRDGEIESILHEYSSPLFVAAGLEPNHVKIHIVQDDSFNAFVTDSRNMFLHTGLLTSVKTPGELKSVIAHEAGHISGGHTISRHDAIRNSTGISLISIGLGILAAALGAPEAGLAILYGGDSMAKRHFFSYSRSQESAADQAALSFLEKTGQSSDGLLSLMEQMRNQEVLGSGKQSAYAKKQSSYYRTHPTSSARIRAVRQRIANRKFSETNPDSAKTIRQLTMMQAKLVGFLGTPEKVRRRFPNSDSSAPARYARAISAFKANDLKTAYAEIDTLISEQAENPWFHELRGQILFENGRAADSIAPNQKALEYGPASALLQVNLARSLLSVGGRNNIEHAEKLLKTALILEPDNAFAWGQIAKAYSALGHLGKAELATAEQAFVLGDMARANHFARRAEARLPLGGVSHRRAKDILSITRNQGIGKKRRYSRKYSSLFPVLTPAQSYQTHTP